MAFHMRVITALAMKARTTTTQANINPFLPYDPNLFVAEVSPTHVALLNKFNVVDHHLVIVTRAFEPQEALLTREDCEALLLCLAEIDGVAFYNAGSSRGQSETQTSATDSIVRFSKFSTADRAAVALRENGRRHRHRAWLAVFACLCPDEFGVARPTEGRRFFVARLLSLATPRRGLARRSNSGKSFVRCSVQSACHQTVVVIGASVPRIFRGDLNQCVGLRRNLAGIGRCAARDPTEAGSHERASARSVAPGAVKRRS